MTKKSKTVKILDKTFNIFIEEKNIMQSVKKIANQINTDYKDKKPIFLIILNGAFVFATDIIKKINIDCEVNFIRVSSYSGMESTKKIKNIIGIDDNIKDRHIIIIEDIVDTGYTMEYILNFLSEQKAKSVKIASLIFKKEKFEKSFTIDYIGFSITDTFIVGYGLDYNGYGRNLKNIYSVL